MISFSIYKPFFVVFDVMIELERSCILLHIISQGSMIVTEENLVDYKN